MSDVAEVRDGQLGQAREAVPLKLRGEAASGTARRARALAMAAPLAWRFAQNYAVAYLEQWITQHQQQAMAQAGPRPAASPPPGPGVRPWPSGGAEWPAEPMTIAPATRRALTGRFYR